MATANKPAENAGTKVVTSKVSKSPVRFSYAHVFEPASMADGQGTPKYSVSIIIPKTNTALVAAVKAAVEAAKAAGLASKFGGKIPAANFKLPLRDGDVERSDDETYKGAFFMTASSKTKPGIVDKDLNPIMDTTEFYSGCYGHASLNFYPFNSNGSKGIACGLNHVQKTEEGEALGGRGRAEDDFGTDGAEDLA